MSLFVATEFLQERYSMFGTAELSQVDLRSLALQMGVRQDREIDTNQLILPVPESLLNRLNVPDEQNRNEAPHVVSAVLFLPERADDRSALHTSHIQANKYQNDC